MKIGGIEVGGPNEPILVLPRNGQNIVFKARAILDYDEFHKLCPAPEPPVKMTPKGVEKDINHPDYVSSQLEYSRRNSAWMIIKTLEPSAIEWTTVKLNVPGTWSGYYEDLRNAGFCGQEINRIVDLVSEANSLDEDKIKWARETFLQGTQA